MAPKVQAAIEAMEKAEAARKELMEECQVQERMENKLEEKVERMGFEAVDTTAMACNKRLPKELVENSGRLRQPRRWRPKLVRDFLSLHLYQRRWVALQKKVVAAHRYDVQLPPFPSDGAGLNSETGVWVHEEYARESKNYTDAYQYKGAHLAISGF